MRKGAEIARAPSLGDWGSPLGGSSAPGIPSSLCWVSRPAAEKSAVKTFTARSAPPLGYARDDATHIRVPASPVRPPCPKLTTFVSRSSAGSQPRSRGPQQSRQTSARQR